MTSPRTNLVPALQAILGASRVFSDPTACASYGVYGIVPSVVAEPSSSEEVAEIVRFAALEKLALIPCGARTKLRIGMPPTRYDIALVMTALNQIVHYDPGDLTLSVGAGTSIAKLNATLLEHRQFLPLLVPWYSLSTIGGTIASGIDSPLRQFYGTARDFLIGAEFVTGSGAITKSGGRVVKNVTGYDLHKLLIGSLGTLAVITRLNFRTFPAPIGGSRGFVGSFPTAEAALALRHAISQSPLTPLTFDIVSPGLAKIFYEKTPATPETAVFSGERQKASDHSLPSIGTWFHPSEWQLCAAFAGPAEVLDRYTRDLLGLAEQSHATSTALLDDVTRPSLWGRLRETLSLLFESSTATTIFKLSVLPSRHAALFTDLQQIADRAGLPHALLARASGTIYFALVPASTNDETTARLAQVSAQVFDATLASAGDPTLLFAPPSINKAVNIWHDFSIRRKSPPAKMNSVSAKSRSRLDVRSQPLETGQSLSSRLKNAFDPHDVFASGRLLT
jgi:glycolate oxidase FAD binding subunit